MRSYQNAALVGAVRDHQHGALALRARGLDEREGSCTIVGCPDLRGLIEDRERGPLDRRSHDEREPGDLVRCMESCFGA